MPDTIDLESASAVNAVNASSSSARKAGQYLTFQLADEAFGVSILAVKEIIEFHSLTEVPGMPACVRGVINLRGAVVPVVDLLARFGRPTGEVTRRTCIVIVEVPAETREGGEPERHVIGVVVDAVNEVLDIAAADVAPPPGFGARVRTDFIHGMGRLRDRFVILLDMQRVLALGDLIAVPAATQDVETLLA